MSTPRRQQLYDHRLVQLVQRTGDITHALACGVPSSTARGWLAREPIEVVPHPAFDLPEDALRVRLARLESRLARLIAVLRIALAILTILRPDFTRLRVPEGDDKRRLLRAIQRGRAVPNLARMLRAIGLSPSRLSAWRRAAAGCELDDAESCPGFSPHALPSDEIDTTATVRREVAFYVEQHNSVIPHHAFKGQTPDEVYFGRGDEVPNQLAEARADARARRMEANRARRCAVCA